MNPACTLLGQPCRNFQFMAAATVVDPRDGREKIVLTNFASGTTGSLVFIDPGTGEGESLPLPGDEGGEGILNLDNETLLVGTAQTFGYLLSLDLRTRTWAKPLRDPDNTYIWNLCRGSDGLIYGGTYPGCHLLRYDPARHTLENLGRISDDPANQYTRFVYAGIPGHILIECGYHSTHLALWNIETRQCRRFGNPGASVREITGEFICTHTNGTLDFYDLRTLEPLGGDLSAKLTPPEAMPLRGAGPVLKLRDGSQFGLRGQEYFILRNKGATPVLKPVPTPRPPTRILALTSDAHGNIWGSCTFGQTIFSFDRATTETWNSQVVCDVGGEVYGIRFARDKLFMAAYCGGDHIVYDPTRPWDQIGNANPRTLQPAGPALIRPSGRSVLGPDGNFWTGWTAAYGVYGGGLSRVNVDTLEVTVWHDPIPKQAINGLAADDRYLYFTTSGDANGLPNAPGPFHFAVWNPGGRVVRDILFAPAEEPCVLAAVAGRVMVRLGGELRVFNPQTMDFEGAIVLGDWARGAIAIAPDRVAVFTQSKLLIANPITRQITVACDIPEGVGAATVTPQGDLYVAAGLNLYRLKM